MPTYSIRKRLLISLLAMVIVASSITLVKNYYDTRHEIEELFDAQLAQAARVLLELSGHELYEQLGYLQQQNKSDISHHIETQIHKYQQEIDFQIWIADNKFLAVRSEKAPTKPLIDVDETFGDQMVNGQEWRVYSLANEDKSVRVQVGQHYVERDILSTSISIRLITSFAIMLPLLAVIILITVGRAMTPLRKIAEQIEHRHVDNLQPINTAEVPDEVQPMIRSINSLFQRLQHAFENIVLFTSNAAHELRTPLAAQKVHAQVAMQAEDDETRNEALCEVVSGVNRATTLVEQLLTLSRLDPESVLQEGDTANLHAVTEDVLAELAPEALQKNIEISLDIEDDAHIHGKPAMVSILVRNIVENAIRYTPDNGTVEVNIADKGDRILLRVADSGPGIRPQEYDKVFTRFYRSPEITVDGTGLGLAMVQRIVEIHHAEIQLSQSKFGGLQMDVYFKVPRTAPLKKQKKHIRKNTITQHHKHRKKN
jgi:two-component system sensor histidine kinase QseC